MLRKEVLSCFRTLHKTRKIVFKDDYYALQEARKRINDEFHKHMTETDIAKIQLLLKTGKEVDVLLRTNVVQAKLNAEGNYEVQITRDTELFNNLPTISRT